MRFQPAQNFVRPDSIVIGTFSPEALGGVLRGMVTSGFASAVWPTGNLAIAFPFTVKKPYRVRSLWVMNGAAVSGNIDLALYDSAYARLVSAGSTPQSGTSVPQSVAIDVTLAPGLYYCALAIDNTTGTTLSKAPASAKMGSMLGMAQQASAFALPNPLVPALMATAYIPLFGLSKKTSI